MKRFVLLAAMLCLAVTTLPAQPKGHSNQGFEKFLNDKIAFIVAEMKLPATDSLRFVPVYTQLQQEKGRIYGRHMAATRELRRLSRQPSAQPVPDSLYLNAVRSDAQLNLEDARLELEFLARFEEILTPRQLFDYQRAEKKFKAKFMTPRQKDAK